LFEGVLACSVEDAALVIEALSGCDPGTRSPSASAPTAAGRAAADPRMADRL
jgi:Asp-tRNA(Asn)/Glu-tRNA(Gln) amidotransferase A subunit family amidase